MIWRVRGIEDAWVGELLDPSILGIYTNYSPDLKHFRTREVELSVDLPRAKFREPDISAHFTLPPPSAILVHTAFSYNNVL
jgi:hypothetical protein